jgi:pimeloyl-ACP methyl ester carboxylesterase
VRKKRSLLKKLFIGASATLLALFLIIIGLVIWLYPGEINFDSPYHPFKTEQAKDEYLKLYDKRAKEWPTISTTKMVNTSYGQTFVRISGPENAAPLVLMHGVGGNSLQWMSNVESLSKYYKVFAIDNVYDNGRSIPSKIMTNANDYVSWLNELFDALTLHDRINIVGLSYGGWITTQYALKFPNRLNKIVLLAPVGTVAQLSPGWIVRAVSVAIPLKYFTRNFVYWLAEDTVNSGAEGRALIEEHIEETFMAVRSFKGKQMVNPSVLTDEELHNIKVPILFMVGENEKIYSPHEVLERLNRVAPQIQTKLIMNAGHDLTMVQAEAVDNFILEFLSQPLGIQ